MTASTQGDSETDLMAASHSRTPSEELGKYDARGKRGPNWTKDETMVLVYFRSRGVCWEACSDLISLKCGKIRTPSSVEDRMRYIARRKPRPRLRPFRNLPGDWDRERVNQWVTENIRSLPHGANLVDLGAMESEIISRVSVLKSCVHVAKSKTSTKI